MNYVQPFLMRKAVGSKIVEYHEALSVKDAVAHLRQHGSFVGMSAYGSRVQLNEMTQQHRCECVVESVFIIYIFSNLSVNDYRLEMPRNDSLSVIVCESLPPVSVCVLHEVDRSICLYLYSPYDDTVDNCSSPISI